jgi:hypothetical protein
MSWGKENTVKIQTSLNERDDLKWKLNIFDLYIQWMINAIFKAFSWLLSLFFDLLFCLLFPTLSREQHGTQSESNSATYKKNGSSELSGFYHSIFGFLASYRVSKYKIPREINFFFFLYVPPYNWNIIENGLNPKTSYMFQVMMQYQT